MQALRFLSKYFKRSRIMGEIQPGAMIKYVGVCFSFLVWGLRGQNLDHLGLSFKLK
jgi:hypothetical protein